MKIIIILIFIVLFVFNKECRILALSGGGAHGSYEAGVIKQLSDMGIRWDIITGVSTGSLNGIALAMFDEKYQDYAINKLKDIWFNITQKDVYRRNWNPLWDQSLYDNTPFNNTIYKFVSDIGNHIKRNIIIGAVCFNTGKLVLFYKENMTTVDDIVNVAMSSSAAPLLFPPHLYKDDYYVDGGLFSNEIIKPGIEYCLNNNLTDIIIDIVSCDQPVLELSTKKIKSDHLISIIVRDYNIALNALLNHELYPDCAKSKRVFSMYIYRPNMTLPGGWFNFEHKYLVDAFKIGYITSPIKTRYCI